MGHSTVAVPHTLHSLCSRHYPYYTGIILYCPVCGSFTGWYTSPQVLGHVVAITGAVAIEVKHQTASLARRRAKRDQVAAKLVKV
jgi:hypothetical protein